ncbi:MAG: lysophospholipid acyltransferase family protein [Pseudomonadota bacterium]
MSDDTKPAKLPLMERLVGLAMIGPIILSRALPYHLRVPFIGWLTSRVVAPIAGYNRRITKNLALVCPELSQEEVREIRRTVADQAGRNIAELFSPEFPEYSKKAPLVGPGVPKLFEAREEGRPVIFVTAHFGSFNAARVSVITNGIDLGVFYRPMSNGIFNPHYVEAMRSLSEPMFEQGRRGMIQMVKHIRAGGVLAILNDLKSADGVPLEFFGEPAMTSLVTAEMALKFDAVLLPVWGLRQKDGLHFETIIEEPIEHSDPVTMTREFNRRLEAAVRENMGQWFWVHRRWKNNDGYEAAKGRELMAKIAKETASDG